VATSTAATRPAPAGDVLDRSRSGGDHRADRPVVHGFTGADDHRDPLPTGLDRTTVVGVVAAALVVIGLVTTALVTTALVAIGHTIAVDGPDAERDTVAGQVGGHGHRDTAARRQAVADADRLGLH
jgi:hypothetical protein